MRVIVIGAGGRLGSQILKASVKAGHDTTAFVRSKARLRGVVGEELLSSVRVVEGDASDKTQLAGAMLGQEAAVQAAGYIGNTYEESKPLRDIVVAVTEAAIKALVGARRLWVLGGAGALNVPGRSTMMVDVLGFPFGKYRIHRDNFIFLSQPRHASLDWSFACPGVMLDAQPPQRGGSATLSSSPPPARVVTDELPVALPAWAALLPDQLLLPALLGVREQLIGPSYEEVAGAIVQHLTPGGPLRHRRVGFVAA